MKSTLTTLFAISFIILTIVACKKETEVVAATPPTLNLTAPVGNEQLSNDMMLKITGDISDTKGLHTLTIKIVDDKTGNELYKATPTVLDLKTYTLDASWKIKVNDWTDATLTVTAANHDGMKTEKIVKFKIWL